MHVHMAVLLKAYLCEFSLSSVNLSHSVSLVFIGALAPSRTVYSFEKDIARDF